MANRYDTNRSGTSPALMEMMNEYTKIPRDSFDESRRKSLDVDLFKLIPFEAFEMLPNSDIDVNFDVALETINPTIKKLQTAMSVEVYVGKCDYNDMWEAWNNFITAGRSGKANASLQIPHILFDYQVTEEVEGVETTVNYCNCIPSSPAHLMNIAPAVFWDSDDSAEGYLNFDKAALPESSLSSTGLTGITTLAILKASTAMFVSCLPFVAYAKMAKKFMNSNLLQDNQNWFPENENHDLILPYNAPAGVRCASYNSPTKTPTKISALQDSSDEDFAPYLNVLFSVDRKNDYFNTGSPFEDLIRGDVPTLSILNSHADFSDAFLGDDLFVKGKLLNNLTPVDFNASGKFTPSYLQYFADTEQLSSLVTRNSTQSDYQVKKLPNTTYPYDFVQLNQSDIFTGKNSNVVKALNKNTLAGIQFSMNQWRYLATMTVFRERMARTDGSYNELIKAQFGHNPKWHSHDIQIVGSHKQSIVFSEVVQTSANGDSALGGTSSLGDVAGRAVSASSSNTIHVHSDDFACYIACLCIRPDEYYTQGVSKMFSRLNPMEQYFPILNNLAPDATLNKELYVSGTNDTDEDVFNYQERFAFYKSRQNEISGYMALPIDKVGEIGAYTLNRQFEDTPMFNSEFVKGALTDNERMLWTGLKQNKFTAVIQSRMRFIGPLPRTTRPSDMGISY